MRPSFDLAIGGWEILPICFNIRFVVRVSGGFQCLIWGTVYDLCHGPSCSETVKIGRCPADVAVSGLASLPRTGLRLGCGFPGLRD